MIRALNKYINTAKPNLYNLDRYEAYYEVYIEQIKQERDEHIEYLNNKIETISSENENCINELNNKIKSQSQYYENCIEQMKRDHEQQISQLLRENEQLKSRQAYRDENQAYDGLVNEQLLIENNDLESKVRQLESGIGQLRVENGDITMEFWQLDDDYKQLKIQYTDLLNAAEYLLKYYNEHKSNDSQNEINCTEQNNKIDDIVKEKADNGKNIYEDKVKNIYSFLLNTDNDEYN